MANNESFVSPNRGGGSGAAAILQPSPETDRFLATYDAMNKQKPDAYYDALGQDISQGLEGSKGVENVNDRMFIEDKKNGVIKLQSELYYDKKPFAQNPEKYKSYYQGKKDLIDWTSKGLRDQKTYAEVNKEVLAKTYKYDTEKSKKAIDEWWAMPLDQRPPRPELVQIDQSNYNKIFQSYKNKGHIKDDANGAFIDGTGNQTRRVSFNEQGAANDFDTTVRINPNTADMQRIFAVAADQAEAEAVKQGMPWSSMPDAVRQAATYEQAKHNYVEAMRSSLTPKTSSESRVNTKEKEGGGGKTPADMESAFTVTANITPTGIKREVNVDLLGFENKDKDNANQSWRGGMKGDKNIIGRAQRIIQEEGSQPYIEISVAGRGEVDDKFEKVPYSLNKEKVIKNYQVDFYKDRPANFNDRYENYVIPEDATKPFTDEAPKDYESRVKIYKPMIDAFNNRKKTTPAKTTTKANTTKTKIDPVDQEFFRK